MTIFPPSLWKSCDRGPASPSPPRGESRAVLPTPPIRPNHYTLQRVAQARGSLNARRSDDLKEQANRLGVLRKVAFSELKETGIPTDPNGISIFRFPITCDPESPVIFLQKHILRHLERDLSRLRWGAYSNSSRLPSGRSAGDALPAGPNITKRERRICA